MKTSSNSVFTLIAAAVLLAGPARATGPTPRTAPASRPTPARPAPAHAVPTRRPVPTAAAVAAAPAAAARTLYLEGTIVGADGRPCPGACVFPTTNPRLIAVTDATGTFHLQLPAAVAPLRLQAEYVGLGSSRVEVDGQHPQPVSIVLGE